MKIQFLFLWAAAAVAAPPQPFTVVDASIPQMAKALDEGRISSRELVTRYLVRIAHIRETAQRYVPAFRAEPVFRQDRFSRGGDHSPFNANGFAAVRFTSAAENLGIQHTATDTFDKSSPEYATFVAKVNGAALASLALAPSAPETTREVLTGSAEVSEDGSTRSREASPATMPCCDGKTLRAAISRATRS